MELVIVPGRDCHHDLVTRKDTSFITVEGKILLHPWDLHRIDNTVPHVQVVLVLLDTFEIADRIDLKLAVVLGPLDIDTNITCQVNITKSSESASS